MGGKKVFLIMPPKRKFPRSRKKAKRRRFSGKEHREAKKRLNAAQKKCFVTLRQCIKDNKSFIADAKALGEPSTLKTIGRNLLRAAQFGAEVALSSDDNPKDFKGILGNIAKKAALSFVRKRLFKAPPRGSGQRLALESGPIITEID